MDLINFSQIKLISLDIWNTLLVSNPNFKQAQIELFAQFLATENHEKLRLDLKWIDEIADRLSVWTGKDVSFERRIEKLAQKYQSEKKPQQNFDEQSLASLYQAMENIFLENLPILMEDDLPETLMKLRARNFNICFLSNTGFVKGETMRKVLERLSILDKTDFAFFSNELGFAKPNEKIFENIIKNTRFQAQEILHIGDNYAADYTGAKKVDFQTLLFEKDVNKMNTFAHTRKIHQIKSLLAFLA